MEKKTYHTTFAYIASNLQFQSPFIGLLNAIIIVRICNVKKLQIVVLLIVTDLFIIFLIKSLLNIIITKYKNM